MDYELLRSRFRQVFEARWERSELENYDELCEKFVFHMTDIYINVGDLAKCYEKPMDCTLECFTDQVELFFNHAVPHLMAAANIFGDIPQIFEEQNGVHDWSFNENELISEVDEPESPIRPGAPGQSEIRN
jgi:hypothetical protein